MHRIRAWARQKAHGPTPLVADPRRIAAPRGRPTTPQPASATGHVTCSGDGAPSPEIAVADASAASLSSSPPEKTPAAVKPHVVLRFGRTVKDILFSSYVNVLLVFVPVGIAAHFAKLSAGIVFAMNAIAIIPLAGLLSHATESVASRMGDTIGALMNVTFGNAVELIIFIALVKDEIEIVQASLVGSILANLLLILGMCFLLGGLRYREQIYNSTVTQMSACLLSLSVSSLLLPTAFHASFSNADAADTKVLEVSRGTSVVLLLVYLLYLVFQLNSHSYMYESTPQDIIERESHPGPAAGYFNSSSDSSSSSSSESPSSDSDTDSSRGTTKRVKRAIKKGRRKMRGRRGNSSLPDNTETPTTPVSPDAKPTASAGGVVGLGNSLAESTDMPVVDAGAAADDEADGKEAQRASLKKEKKKKHRKNRHRKTKNEARQQHAVAVEEDNENKKDIQAVLAVGGIDTIHGSHGHGADGHTRRVDFALAPDVDVEAQVCARTKPFSLRTLANPVGAVSKTLSTSVFHHAPATGPAGSSMRDSASALPQPQLRRTASVPTDHSYRHQPNVLPPIVPIVVNRPKTVVVGDGDDVGKTQDDADDESEISRTTAVLLLLASTGLVALCAEFMVGSINEVVSGNSGLSEAFIGLILLPIVGNAAEHVTGVTVAMKNKMDLALGVALGSSIQIAIFVTPVVVLLGWAMGKDMSLYFTLFETVSMFVSAFIVNFLVLDGRSNYLEGALLCAAYVIIAVAAFFYPGSEDANELGGGFAASHSANSTEARAVVVETARLAARGLMDLWMR